MGKGGGGGGGGGARAKNYLVGKWELSGLAKWFSVKKWNNSTTLNNSTEYIVFSVSPWLFVY